MIALRSSLLLMALALLPGTLLAQPKYATEVYQDFRGKPPMLPEFRLIGPDLDAVTTSEADGFRVTLPKTRAASQPVQIAATFVISGDFEITGSYEMLAADVPKDGWGTGVSLNIADTNDLHKFLKIARLMRPNVNFPASVFMAEYWTKGAKDWKGPQVPTKVRSGQLRLVRKGTTARCQASDGPGKEFVTIFQKENFGAEDIVNLRYMVTDGNKPGYAVDARLVDLRVRYGNVDEAAKAANDPIAPAPSVPVQEQPKAGTSGSLALVLAVGVALTLLLAIAFGLVLYFRKGRRAEEHAAPAAANVLSIACAACGKGLKVNAASAGKRIKCPKCAQVVVIPSEDKVDG